MTDVEIAVSFVALLGGLLLANVANNMADALRARRDLPIGFVPWAINFYISARVINAFVLLAVRDLAITFDMLALLGILAGLMPYIMVSRLLYPEHKERWASVEEYYIANRKLILGIMLIGPAAFAFNQIYIDSVDPLRVKIFQALVSVVPVIATLVLLMLTEKRQWHWAGWGFLIAHGILMMVVIAIYN